jgi:hypothetical protein
MADTEWKWRGSHYLRVTTISRIGINERVLHRESGTERLGREVLKNTAHDVGGTRLDPLLGLIDLIFEAAFEEPITNIVTIDGESI